MEFKNIQGTSANVAMMSYENMVQLVKHVLEQGAEEMLDRLIDKKIVSDPDEIPYTLNVILKMKPAVWSESKGALYDCVERGDFGFKGSNGRKYACKREIDDYKRAKNIGINKLKKAI